MFLEINQIRKSFGEGDNRVEVLKGIDLAIEKGEFCVLLCVWFRQIDVAQYYRRH